MFKNVLVLFVACLFLTGCQLVPTKYDEHTEGQWEAKVLIKDHVKSKSFIVKVDAFAVRDQSLRLDVTAALGTPVASLVLAGDEVKYILPRQKKYYEGQSSPKVLRPILSVPVDPKLFYSLLFDVVPTDSAWACEKDKNGFLQECKNPDHGLNVSWKDRKGRKKSIYIEHKKASMQMNVTWFKPSLEGTQQVFSMTAPKKFKKYRIK